MANDEAGVVRVLGGELTEEGLIDFIGVTGVSERAD